jgi:hypothetical protein
MDIPEAWQNPINQAPGLIQNSINPKMLRPSRSHLSASRLMFQRQLLLSGKTRFTPILVSSDGVIIDGHHAARAAAEENRTVDVMVSSFSVAAQADSILDLPLR